MKQMFLATPSSWSWQFTRHMFLLNLSYLWTILDKIISRISQDSLMGNYCSSNSFSLNDDCLGIFLEVGNYIGLFPFKESISLYFSIFGCKVFFICFFLSVLVSKILRGDTSLFVSLWVLAENKVLSQLFPMYLLLDYQNNQDWKHSNGLLSSGIS